MPFEVAGVKQRLHLRRDELTSGPIGKGSARRLINAAVAGTLVQPVTSSCAAGRRPGMSTGADDG